MSSLIVTTAEPPAMIVPMLQVISPAVSEHVPDDPATLNVVPVGSESVTTTPVESDVPVFDTVIV